MGSWIHDGFLDSRWVPGFTMGSWIHDGFLVLGTARIIRARHGNIWHGTDPPELGTARDVPVIGRKRTTYPHWGLFLSFFHGPKKHATFVIFVSPYVPLLANRQPLLLTTLGADAKQNLKHLLWMALDE